MDVGGEAQVYHLSQRGFLLNARPHRLVLLKQLTRELAAQEVSVWTTGGGALVTVWLP